MIINYENRGFAPLYQYELAKRHFQAAFLKTDSIQSAVDRHLLQSPVAGPITLGSRIKHFLLGVIEALPIIGLITAVFDRIVNHKNEPVNNTTTEEPKTAHKTAVSQARSQVQILV